jgi:hypothetical protein
MDSLSNSGTIYSSCTSEFKKEKHEIDYSKLEFENILSYFEEFQKIKIILPPIAQTNNNLQTVNKLKHELIQNKLKPFVINIPYTLNENLWYDQWYHLNKCGRCIETENIVNLIKKELNNEYF